MPARRAPLGAALLAVLAVGACSRPAASASGDAEPATHAANEEVAAIVATWDRLDFDDASRGLVARAEGTAADSAGRVVFDASTFAFVRGPAPETVNPSLWRHAALNGTPGLYRVVEGVWQVRGFDIANLTIVRGATGWILVDPLTSSETAAAALAFARKHLGTVPVSAVIFTHSHIDHFGGVLGVLPAAEAAARHVPVIAPAGVLEEAVSENVMVGTAMGRRSAYQFGKDLLRSARGFVDNGLGKSVGYGTFGILAPTHEVTAAAEPMTIDGVHFVFHNMPGAEAPAEMTFSLPGLKAYDGAELVAQTMHNLLPLRGAKLRNAARWAAYLDAALVDAAGADVLFMQHNWPVWGAERITAFITAQRDVYKYTHDQTVRLINAGYTAPEIANMVTLPPSLQSALGSRGYYGDLRHNVEAVYEFYMGAYDGNPSHLDRLPPADASLRYVKLMGGADKVVGAAQTAFDAGDYRWAAELLNHVVFAEPRHAGATALLARTYDQLGYQAESATWRNAYLTGARELRNGPPAAGVDRRSFLRVFEQTPVENFLDATAASIDGPAAEGKHFKINLVVSDRGESHVLWIEHAVLHHKRAAPAPDADATLTLTKGLLVRVLSGDASITDAATSDQLSVRGSKVTLLRFLALIDKAKGTFPIVTP